MQVTDRAAAAQDFAEGSGEVDPLDAFMEHNDQALAAGEEVDPLDAFMANEIAPAVRRDATADAAAEVKVKDSEDVKPAVQVNLLPMLSGGTYFTKRSMALDNLWERLLFGRVAERLASCRFGPVEDITALRVHCRVSGGSKSLSGGDQPTMTRSPPVMLKTSLKIQTTR